LTHRVGFVSLALAAASVVAAQPVPADLATLTAKAGLDGSVAAWCRGAFRSGHPRAFALGITSGTGRGHYVVLEMDATVTELASYTDGPDLACYTRAEARKLNDSIRRSETIHGQITPRWSTAVICAFVDGTTAVCWQYSPTERVFVKVGGWVT
jgi:hypothetical protein